jgi:endonuclease/exonuclease/phosphatase family metal-dependent hydrolase
MHAIGRRLADGVAQVWAFQEVWTEDARRILSEAAEAAGFQVAHGGGGLMVASQLPIESAAFRSYTLAGIATHLHRGDYTGGKGFQTLRLRTPAGPLVLVNTHLHAQYHTDDRDPYLGHRVGQVVELAASLRSVHEPLVAAGDFNMREDHRGYGILTGLTGLEDAAVSLDRRELTSSSGTRIDFILTRGPRPRSVGVFAERGLVSDHAGVAADLEIARGSPFNGPDSGAVAEARALLATGRAEAARRRRLDRVGVVAATAAGAGALALRPVSRRRFLLGATAALALPAALLSAVSAERWVSGEIDAFDRVLALLDEAF